MKNKTEILRIGGSRLLGIVLLGLVLTTGLAASASADTVYSYTGNRFNEFANGYTCPAVCNVSGSFTLASPLADNLNLQTISPVDFSFSDGSNVWNPSSTFSAFKISTDGSGDITGWELFYISFGAANPTLLSENCPGCTIADISLLLSPNGPFAAVYGDPGTWTATPEPSTLLLFGTGLLGLVSAQRRFRFKLLSSSIWPHAPKTAATQLQTASKNPFSTASQRRST